MNHLRFTGAKGVYKTRMRKIKREPLRDSRQ